MLRSPAPAEKNVTDSHRYRLAYPIRRGAPWLVAALLLTTVGIPSVAALSWIPAAPWVGYARDASGPSTVTVNLTDAPAFSPRYLTAAAGTSLSVHLVNVGQYGHTFTLAATPDVQLPSNATPTGVFQFFQRYGSLANVSVAPGGQGWANVSFNASSGLSSFEFASVVPYQFQAGMFGFVNITSSGPGLLLSENTTDSFQFVPNTLAASPTHYPVELNVLVTNTGALGHTFTLAAQSNVSLSPANFSQYFSAHPPLVSVPIPSGAGQTVWANFSVSKPGVYQYICEVTGHFANGMTGFLYVGVPVPAAPPAPSTAIVEGWVLAGSGVLLAIGIVLALIASFTGRFPRSPPSHGRHH